MGRKQRYFNIPNQRKKVADFMAGLDTIKHEQMLAKEADKSRKLKGVTNKQKINIVCQKQLPQKKT